VARARATTQAQREPVAARRPYGARRAPRGRVVLTVLVAVAGLLAGATATALATLWRQPGGVIAGGVHVAGMDWSGKRVEDAAQALGAWAEHRLAEPLHLRAVAPSGATREWSPTRKALGASVDVAATIAEAQRVGERRGAFARLVAWFAGDEKVEIAPVWRVERPVLLRYLKRTVAPTVRREAVDARFVASGDTYTVSPERAGVALDVARAAELVEERLPLQTSDTLDLPSTAVAPRVVAKDFEGIDGEIARFETRYHERGNRRRNIELACARINGTLLKPGEVFSYNETVGPRDFGAGFREAPVIVRGRLEPGLGGGVCQVSTTLYNAVLLSNLGIVSRQHHAFPVHYVPPGRDATVVYGAIDFRFRNTTGGPIAIHSDGTRGRVLMRVFGRRDPAMRVVLQRQHLASYAAGEKQMPDPSLASGKRRVIEKGHAGHRVRLYRVVTKNGRPVTRELISSDYYRPFPRIVAVGAAPARRPATPPPGASEVDPASEPPAATP